MHRECQERFPRHRLQRKPLFSNPDMHSGTCVTHVPCCMSGSLIRVSYDNVSSRYQGVADLTCKKFHIIKFYIQKVYVCNSYHFKLIEYVYYICAGTHVIPWIIFWIVVFLCCIAVIGINLIFDSNISLYISVCWKTTHYMMYTWYDVIWHDMAYMTFLPQKLCDCFPRNPFFGGF